VADDARAHSFGEGYSPTAVDRLGVWLSARMIRRHADGWQGRRIGDFGCGYHATFVRSTLDVVDHAVLADVSLAPDLIEHPKVTALVGSLPDTLPQVSDASLDLAMCTSVIEHLWDPLDALRHLRRVTRPGGRVLVNVPTWRGKRFLEFSAFRLGTSPAAEMDDHKTYYDPRDLWPLLVRAGFLPSGIRCTTHKLGLNTFAVCTVPDHQTTEETRK
jgi:SAM-dependent methyltransferase